MDASDILDSDQRIMAQTVVRNGILSFNFGDGHAPLQGKMDGVLNSKQIIQWCNAVRGEYNARKDRKENQEDRPAADVRSTPQREDAPTPVGSGSGLPVEEGVKGAKAAMEAGIESALVELGRRGEAVLARLADAYRVSEALEKELGTIGDMTEYYTKLKEKVCAM